VAWVSCFAGKKFDSFAGFFEVAGVKLADAKVLFAGVGGNVVDVWKGGEELNVLTAGMAGC